MANLLKWLGNAAGAVENAIGTAADAVIPGNQSSWHSAAPLPPTGAPPAAAPSNLPTFNTPTGLPSLNQVAPNFSLPKPATPTPTSPADLIDYINNMAKLGPKAVNAPTVTPDDVEQSNGLQGTLQAIGQIPLLGVPVQVGNQINDMNDQAIANMKNGIPQYTPGMVLGGAAATGVANSPLGQAGQLFGDLANEYAKATGVGDGTTSAQDNPLFGDTSAISNQVADKGVGQTLLDTVMNTVGAVAPEGKGSDLGGPTVKEAADTVKAANTALGERGSLGAPSDDAQNLAKSASANDPAFQASIAKLAADNGLTHLPGPPKLADRIHEKAVNDYGGDVSQVQDGTRATLAVPDPAKVEDIVKQLGSQYEINRYKNDFDKEGYKDAKVNVKLPDGSLAEVQMTTPEMLEAKKAGGGHAMYKEARSTVDAGKLDQLNSQMKTLYDAAWSKTQARLAAERGAGTSRPSTTALAGENGLPVETTVPRTVVPLESNRTSTSPTSKNLTDGAENTDDISSPFNSTIAQNDTKSNSKVADTAYKQTVANGGVTINLKGKQPADGLAFSPYKDTEHVVDKNDFTPQVVDDYMKAHAEQLKAPGNHLGLWEDDGKVYLDISQVGDKSAATLQKAMDAKQLAAFDLGTFDEVPLGKMDEKGYTALHEAAHHPYLDRGQDSGASTPGASSEPAKVSGNSGSGVPEIPHTATPQPPTGRIVPNKFTESVRNSPEVSPEVQKAVTGEHEERNTQALVDQAQSDVKTQGLDTVTSRVLGELSKKAGDATDETLATAIVAAKAHDALGTDAGHEMATNLYDQIAEHGVGSGRRSQILATLAKRTPEGQRYMAEKFLKKANVEITPELKAQIKTIIDKMKNSDAESQEHYTAQQQLAKLVNRRMPAKNIDKIFRLWRTGLLTGPKTMAKVVLSHTVMNAMEAAKDVPAVAVDNVARGFNKLIGHDSFKTTALTGKGQVGGFARGTAAGAKLLATGIDTKGSGGFTGFNTEMGKPQARFTSPALKWLNPYMDKVEQIHAALPKGFYRAAYENDLNKQAIAQATNQHLKGADRSAFIRDFVANPPGPAHFEADHAGQMASFQQETTLGKAGSKLQAVPGGRVLSPFAHIASSILTDAINYSPIGAAKTVIEAVRDNGKAGWTPEIQKHFSEGLGRSIVGTALVATGAALYKGGVMTLGYPSDPKERALWTADGKQENSILLNGKWRQLASLGPQAITLAMGGYAASSTDVGGKKNAAAGALAGSIKTLMGESFLSGLSDASAALTDPQQSAGSFMKNEAGSVVPIAVATAASAFDPNQRTATSVLDSIKSKLPGARETLPVKQDGLGNQLPREGGVITNLIDPTRPTTAISTPPIDELNRLDSTHNPVFPVPVKTIGSGSNAVPLTQAQQDMRNALAGPLISSAYQTVISSTGYDPLSDPNKAKALSNAAADVNAVVNAQTLQQVAPDKFDAAYAGLTANQKAMFNGAGSTKNYTALNADGTTVASTTAAAKKTTTKAATTKKASTKVKGVSSSLPRMPSAKAYNAKSSNSAISKLLGGAGAKFKTPTVKVAKVGKTRKRIA